MVAKRRHNVLRDDGDAKKQAATMFATAGSVLLVLAIVMWCDRRVVLHTRLHT